MVEIAQLETSVVFTDSQRIPYPKLDHSIHHQRPAVVVVEGDSQPPPSEEQQQQQQQHMFREKWSQLRNSITKIPSKMGSWMSFFDLKQFSFPASVTELSLRCPANLQVFYANYLVCCLLLLTYCLIASPFLLLGMAIFIILFYVIMKINKPIMVGGKEFTRNQQLIALALVSIPLFLLLGITSTFFWLIGASTCLIGLHSIFHESPKSPVDSVAEGDNVADSNGFQVITAT